MLGGRSKRGVYFNLTGPPPVFWVSVTGYTLANDIKSAARRACVFTTNASVWSFGWFSKANSRPYFVRNANRRSALLSPPGGGFQLLCFNLKSLYSARANYHFVRTHNASPATSLTHRKKTSQHRLYFDGMNPLTKGLIPPYIRNY